MTDPARSFGSAASAYDRGRPSYPREAVEWMVGQASASVLELGAGTGKLTRTLVDLGYDVFATDPDEAMLDVLCAKLPETRATVGTAEQIPAPDASVDVVVAGQAFHWFDHPVALAEIARVLRPGGHLALVWNHRDERIPWVRRLGALMGGAPGERVRPDTTIAGSELFSATEERSFKHWQVIDRDSVQDLVLSRSYTITLPEEEREAKRAEVLAFYDDFGRGMDGMQLPYVTTCYRATVLPRAVPPVSTVTTVMSGDATSGTGEPGQQRQPRQPRQPDRVALLTDPHDTAARLPRVVTEPPAANDDDTGLILIDFR
jgi:ubiquinone/menaquinone biosynthesis C-methylase UbiE